MDQVVYITGGSKGIGKGVAAYLLQKGYRVAISSRRLESAQQAARELGNTDRVLPLQSDVRNLSDEQQAVQTILNQWGRLDVLVANAGVGHFAPFEQMTPELWHETIDTNLNGVYNSVRASVEAIKKSKGYIFTIASLAGTNFMPQGTAYNASKFAVVGFTQALMLDLRQYDVRVTTIMPGSVASYFNNHVPSEADSWKIQPEDIGELIYDLLQMHPRALPSKIEIRPTKPPVK
ncbi:NADP-dependent 3-hydroxy acid dehydrogenase YdfG [Thermoflavifilum aggregans]|uniref:NADP-dependent 3-hydroxy acid dehydrogenase YdfG n=1 Tax=Thermoflavifilum aggregans TaxID=454188 RepID=A0A2M9CU82_9BACT|nr:SDR family oxidoreductase [Thermoflavifilum aggregans]PJJ75476.1 NADP-dependent 3-hydroxy acid dehydrogenase YdfG [Thermoflavifilum aggregans]